MYFYFVRSVKKISVSDFGSSSSCSGGRDLSLQFSLLRLIGQRRSPAVSSTGRF